MNQEFLDYLDTFQTEVETWSFRNFGDQNACPVELAALGLAEEVGELCRALLKRKQGIRGSRYDWNREVHTELADVLIKLFDVAARENVSIADCLAVRWPEVAGRDFVTNPIGHGMPGGWS